MFLARREMRRFPGRFVLLTGAVALLVVLLLFFQTVAATLTGGLTGGIEANAADVVVYDALARSNPAASFLDDTAEEQVAGVEGVAAASPVGLTAFVLDDEDVTVVGYVPDTRTGPASIDAGRPVERAGEAVFSAPALSEGRDVGERVTIEGVEVEIVGTTEGAAFSVGPTYYVARDDLATMAANRAEAEVGAPVSWIGVEVDAGADAATVAARIGAEVDGVEALTRSSAADALPGVSQVTRSFTILYVLLFVVVTIVTGVFFLILTVQKERTLVLLRAVGARARDVVAPVVTQVLLVTGVGAAVGVIVAGGLLAAARDTFGSSLDAGTAIRTVVVIVVLGLVASLGAVRRVLSVEPIAATTAEGR